MENACATAFRVAVVLNKAGSGKLQPLVHIRVAHEVDDDDAEGDECSTSRKLGTPQETLSPSKS